MVIAAIQDDGLRRLPELLPASNALSVICLLLPVILLLFFHPLSALSLLLSRSPRSGPSSSLSSFSFLLPHFLSHLDKLHKQVAFTLLFPLPLLFLSLALFCCSRSTRRRTSSSYGPSPSISFTRSSLFFPFTPILVDFRNRGLPASSERKRERESEKEREKERESLGTRRSRKRKVRSLQMMA